MSTSTCGTLIPQDKVNSFQYTVEATCVIPPAFVSVIREVQYKYESRETTVVGYISYYPNDTYAEGVTELYNLKIYVVRLKTSLAKPVKVHSPIFVDVHIYSCPLLHSFHILQIRQVDITDWNMKIGPLCQSDMDAIHYFQTIGATLYNTVVKAGDSFNVEMVETAMKGSRIPTSAALLPTRDILDLLSMFHAMLNRHIVKVVSEDMTRFSMFPTMVPLCYVSGMCGKKLYILRCLEAVTQVHYDCQFKVCPWNTSIHLESTRLVHMPYEPFVPYALTGSIRTSSRCDI